MDSTAHRSYRKIKIKYFTPPSTFEALGLEFRQSANYMKALILDFLMALSKVFQTISHVLLAVWEALEAVVHFLLTILNVIWLVLKIILVLGEEIKALGPKGQPQHTQQKTYYKQDSGKTDSINSSPINSHASKRQHVEYNDVTMEATRHNHTWRKPVYSDYPEKETIFSTDIRNKPSSFNVIKKEPAREMSELSNFISKEADFSRKETSCSDFTTEKPSRYSVTKSFVHSKYIRKDNDFSAPS